MRERERDIEYVCKRENLCLHCMCVSCVSKLKTVCVCGLTPTVLVLKELGVYEFKDVHVHIYYTP